MFLGMDITAFAVSFLIVTFFLSSWYYFLNANN